MPEPLPFEAFMQKALYDPKTGYYARQIETVGGRGDFTTAAMLSDHLAGAIGTWAAKALKETGCRNLVEIGPGTGKLAAAVWKALPWTLRRKCRLHLVEISEPLMAQQAEVLGHKVHWHKSPAEALEACEGKAVIYSNELVDAFPCRRFELCPEGWQELGVTFNESKQASEELLPAAELPNSSLFKRDFAIGQRVEVHESYREWLETWLPLWKDGRMLTIDYGADVDELYSRQPQGSLRAYFLQQRLIGPDIYQNIGRQDLTADVNFSDLIAWSQPWTSGSHLQTLGAFLADTKAEKRLLDPQGAGGAFKVLEQRSKP